MVRNWKYYTKAGDIGKLKITNGQYMTGNILGILVEENDFLNPRGNLVNAKTFDFPVRYKTVRKYTGLNYDDVANDIRNGILELELEGCRAIITSGGQLGAFHDLMHEITELMVLASPLEIIHFVRASIAQSQYLCIVNNLSVEDNIAIMREMDIHEEIIEQCIFADTELAVYRYYDNEVFRGDKRLVGSYIWDSIECPQNSINEVECPVYSIVLLARFIKNAVMQIPYEGGI